MGTPIHELPEPQFEPNQLPTSRSSDEEHTYVGDGSLEGDPHNLPLDTSYQPDEYYRPEPSPSRTREVESRLNDDLAMLQAERVVSSAAQEPQQGSNLTNSASMKRSRSRRSAEIVDDFDVNTNPVHEKNAVYRPPEHPSTNFAKLFKKIHNSSFLVRYFTYITPVVVTFLIPLLLGALVFKDAHVGGTRLMWFSVWLEIFWLTLWAGRIVAKMIPWPLGLISSLFTNNSKKWRDMGKQLEVPATIFLWWLGIEVSFLPTMNSHMTPDYTGDQTWKETVNKIIVAIFVGTTLNFVEKIIMQLIAISFHLRTYADRIELNKFQIGCLVKLYTYSKERLMMDDSDFEDGGPSGPASGTRTPMQYLDKAQKNVTDALHKVGDVAGKVAGDFTGRKVVQSTHPHQVVLMLLNSTPGSQVLARRLYRTFKRDDAEMVISDDLKNAFDNNEEADAAFSMFDKDMNGDISMEELEAVCVEIGRERKSITASLKDLDSVVSKLDGILLFVVVLITILVFVTLISTSAAGVLTSAGSTVLALSWLFSATAQEFLQSIIFVFVKHPFDVGDRVSIYGNTGPTMKGDDFFVKEISLLFTEFKKMEGQVVQAPNSYLNTLFILNMRRSGGLAEAVTLSLKFGTTLEHIEELRNRLIEFVKAEKREFQSNILTEIRDVVEAHSINLNVVFFYKSNWQNELLRLQRRNKFICALMVSMQEIGLQGPRMRIPGQSQETPFYIQYPPPYSIDLNIQNDGGPGPRSGSLVRDHAIAPESPRHTGSILRHTLSAVNGTRARGESVSSLSKRVDFSLGMKDISSANMMGDVYDDASIKARVPDMSKISVSRSRSSRNGTIEEEEDPGRTASRDWNGQSRFGLHRTSTESQTRLRGKDPVVHRNRFFGRRRAESSTVGEDEDLMEQGIIDLPENEHEYGRSVYPRSGTAGTQAIKMNTNSGVASSGAGAPRPLTRHGLGPGSPPVRTMTDDFEMIRMER